MPLDLVIIALGTNDTGYRHSALEIGLNAMRLASLVQGSAGGVVSIYPAPAVLLVAPAPLAATVASGPFGAFFTDDSLAVSRSLAEVYTSLGAAVGIPVVRTADATPTDGADGVHLEPAGHAALGKAVAAAVRKALPPP